MTNPFRPQAQSTGNPFLRPTGNPFLRPKTEEEEERTALARAAEPDLTLGQEAGGLVRSVARGATLGISPRIEAAVRGVPLEQVREEMGEYSAARPKTALAGELVGGALTGGAGLLRSAGATGARAILPRLLGTAVGQGAVSGAAESTGGVGEMAKGAAIGGAIGGVAPKAVSAIGRVPGVRRVTQGIGEMATEGYERGSRALANLLEGTPGQRIGRALEPMDVTRAQRIAGEGLPGSVQGPTVTSLVPDVSGLRDVVRTARTAEQEARDRALAAQRAVATAQEREASADASRVAFRDEARQQASERGVRRAQEIAETGEVAQRRAQIASGRTERLRQAALESRTAGRTLERELKDELTAVERQTREEAKAAAEATLETVRREAGETVGALRGQQARGTAARLQKTIRDQQTAMGEESYTMLRQIGPPPDVDPNVYVEILNDPTLRTAYRNAVRTIRREASRPEALQQGLRPPRTVMVNERELPELDVYALDLMRRNVREQAGRVGPNATGLTRSQAKAALEQIGRLEERFLAGYGSSDVGERVQAVRAAYRAEFAKLEALQDGLNLGAAKAGRASGLLKQSPKELDEVIQRVETMNDAERAAFQVGAREWFSRMVAESPDDALAVAKKFGSEASRERLALAYGPEAVEQLTAFAPRAVGARTAAAAEQVRESAQGLIAGLQQRQATEPASLFERAERARALQARAAERGSAARGAVPALRRAQQVQEAQLRAEAEQAYAPLSEAARTAARERRTAQSAARTATNEARQAAAERSAAATALREALAEGRDVRTALRGTLRDPEKAADLTRLMQGATPALQAQTRDVLGSTLQRQVQQMVASGRTAQEITQTLVQAEQNPAVRALMAEEIARTVQAIQRPTAGAVAPRAFVPSFGGFASRTILREGE